MIKQFNYKGESVVGVKRRLLKPEYGKGYDDKYGDPEINWGYFIVGNDDNDGFDMENRESNGYYLIDIVLPKDTIIIRYGNEMGFHTAPKGTTYEELAMPYDPETLEYNEYRVQADGLRVQCKVKKGKIAYSIEGTGGGVQYLHQETIRQLVDKGILERINLWD